jgi:uncharacterized protein (TIRG00374 family)
MEKTLKQRILPPLKLLITAALFYAILRQVDSDEMLATLSRISPADIFTISILTFLMQFLHVLKWQTVLSVTPLSTVPFRRLFYHHFTAFFFQLFLPSAASGDIIKGTRLGLEHTERAHAAASVIFARVTGFVVLAVLGIGAILYNPDLFFLLPARARILFICIYPLLMAAVIILFTPLTTTVLHHRIVPRRFRNILEKFQKSLRFYLHYPRVISMTLIFALIIFLILVLITFLIFAAIETPLSWRSLLMVMPVITVLTFIPFTVNGAGIREYMLLISFPVLSGPDVVSFAALFYSATLAVGLIGGLLFAAESLKGKPRKTPPVS